MKSSVCASTPFTHHDPVRLACVKHAASVHPEPGSNSRIIILLTASSMLAIFVLFDSGHSQTLAFLFPFYFCCSFCFLKFILSWIFRAALLFICQGALTCGAFYQTRSFSILPQPDPFVKPFFKIIWRIFQIYLKGFGTDDLQGSSSFRQLTW